METTSHKRNLVYSLDWVQIMVKEIETTCNINISMWPRSCQWTSCSTVAGQQVLQRRLEPWRWEAHSALVISSWPWPTERITEADPLATNYTKLPKSSMSTILWSILHLKQIGKVTKLNKWGALWADRKSKSVILKCHLHSTQHEP